MLTQIFIQPQESGCQPEYTKIASHSFGFTGDFFRGAQDIEKLYFAGDYDPVNGTEYPVWSATKYNFGENYVAGSLGIRDYEKTAGIALPINLVPDDKITLSGTAYYPYYEDWIDSGFTSVTLIVGVYYFNCSDREPRLFTFIPVTLTDFDEFGTACFNAEVTLGSSFDFHETRIVIGYNTYATGDAVTPGSPTILTVSHTLDIERPCKAEVDNFIIKNCCEGSITELVNIPGLVVGDFHVDNEGNCWEVMSESNDVTNFTRNFVDTYASCLECQDDNGCPLNLMIKSCCVEGKEFVTGSLPGLVVGDTFLDNYGLCWYVEDETPAPISEESITVVSIIEGSCETCTTANPCPNFYEIVSCCGQIRGYIAVPDVLNEGDSFVDAQGQCWNVTKKDAGQLPTIYGVEVVTVYTGAVEPDTNCDLCIAANPCPTEYFITIKSCCDHDRVEVAEVPAEFMFFTEGLIFSDYWKICWEVTSFSTTGIATFEIWPWNDAGPSFSLYKECRECIENNGCIGAYNIKDCQTDIVYNNVVLDTDGPPSIGSFYAGSIISESFGEINSCFEVLSLGYPTYPLLIKGGLRQGPFATCPECQLARDTTKTLEFSQCCGGPNIIVEYAGSWYNGIGFTALLPLSDSPEGVFVAKCVTLVGFSTATPTLYNITGATIYTGDCATCFSTYNIECP
jgi:hypothetical protein